MNLTSKAQSVSVVLLDVDGVLTDGCFAYSENNDEIKFFNARDGHALKLLRRAGLETGILSGRSSKTNERRAHELDMSIVRQGEKDKPQAFEKILAELDIKAEECLYMGDDLVDIPVMKVAGIGVAVGDATIDAQESADWVTEKCGGKGAVQEMAINLLKMKKLWGSVVERYTQRSEDLSPH